MTNIVTSCCPQLQAEKLSSTVLIVQNLVKNHAISEVILSNSCALTAFVGSSKSSIFYVLGKNMIKKEVVSAMFYRLDI